jgi:peptide/nickel transport system substrate-binding protein
MTMKRSLVGMAGAVTAVVALAAVLTATASTSNRAAGPTRGGNLVIDRREDSQSFDLTSVFQNESIWPGEQIMEPLYVNTPDGKGLRPWLATSYSASHGGTVYTFHLRPGVRFSNGRPMTSADVKFSIDQSRAATKGWGYIDQAIKSVETPDRHTVVIHLKYRWAPFLSDISTFSNGIVPKGYLGQTKAAFYKHPVGTGPFMWDKRVVGQTVTLKRNPYYWQKGKPYLDSVTFSFVSDDNARQLQLLGGKAQVDEFPPFNSVSKLQHTPGVTLKLFPSTRTDYLLMNEHYPPLADAHVRRAISDALDRAGIVKAVLFGNGKPANSFIPPGLPCYNPSTPGAHYDISKAKAELGKSKFPHGFKLEMTVASGDQVHQAIGQILQNALKPLGIDLTFKQVDSSTEYANIQQLKYQIGISYWQNDNIDPDELATFAVDPGGGAHSWFTGYNDPKVTALVHKAQHETKPAARCRLYAKMQTLAAQDAFAGFIYYSPFPYAYSTKVHGFFVSPLGNFHLENVWLG